MFPEDLPTASAAVDLGDEGGWRTNEGEGWTAEEDTALLASRWPEGAGGGRKQPVGWKAVAAAVGGGRSAKQCRERWGGLQPWTAEEDARLLALYDARGPAWSAIAQQSGLQDRTKRHLRARAAQLLKERAASAPDGAGMDEGEAAQRAAREWEAVNRRRVRGKGWHVDIGPGFDTDWLRTAEGHRFQGCVVLVLLSDCGPGQGGTALATRSHSRVADYLRGLQKPEQEPEPQPGPEPEPEPEAEPEPEPKPEPEQDPEQEQEQEQAGGVPHQQLNSWCISQVTQAMADGSLPYRRHPADDDTRASGAESAEACSDAAGGWGAIEQVVGKAGDVVLVHPWCEPPAPYGADAWPGSLWHLVRPRCVHSGTTNLGGAPRLLLNGMARLKQQSFEARGHPLLRGA